MTTIPVKVLLNATSRFMGYGWNAEHGGEPDSLYQAISFDSPPPSCGSMKRLLDIIWEQLNIDVPQTNWAIEYRRRRNRSLSVGDVVVLGEQAWACESVGWRPVSVALSQVWHVIGILADDSVVYAQPREEV